MFKHETIDMSRNWKFCLGGEWNEAAAQTVCFPHPVTITPAISSGGRNYQGKCIYKKNFFAPEDYRGKKVILEFEGLMGVSRLSVNGEFVGAHFCGYTPFVIDLTDVLCYGEDNMLRIDLDNSDDPDVPPGKPQGMLDFTYEGGIYRKARLSIFEPLYITHPLLQNEVAGGGVFVHYENVCRESAQVHARIQLKNEFSTCRDYTLRVVLTDKNGKMVASEDICGKLENGQTVYQQVCFHVDKPDLWSIFTPNLYTLHCELLSGEEMTYACDTEIGIRTFYFTVNDGVIFNGVSHRFNGVNYHQTWPYIGNAVPDGLLIRDMMKLKEMGCENIRSHYPFSHAVTDACNRLGMTLIVSNPGWQFCREGLFMERARQNMRDIVRWQRNNPCILIWEPILNESVMTHEIQQAFHDIVHEEYPYSDCYTASDYGPTDINYKDYMANMIADKNYDAGVKRENKPIWTREYGDAPDNFVDQNTVWRVPRAFGDFPQMESVNRLVGRYSDAENKGRISYAKMYNDKSRCGYGIWPGIAHNRGYNMNPCYGGHLDLFRIPKFSYYFMQSQMDREQTGDVLFIANYLSDISPDDVMVISNADRVELICDGQVVGIQTPDVLEYPVKHPPFTFKNVRSKYKKRFEYEEARDEIRSELIAKAYVGDEVVAETRVKTPGRPKYLRLEADLMGMPLRADGADIVAVRCHVCDIDGQTSPFVMDGHPIYFELEGEGEIIGDIQIFANPVFPEAGIATILVRTTQNAGQIKIKARLYFDSLTNESHAYSAITPAELIIHSI